MVYKLTGQFPGQGIFKFSRQRNTDLAEPTILELTRFVAVSQEESKGKDCILWEKERVCVCVCVDKNSVSANDFLPHLQSPILVPLLPLDATNPHINRLAVDCFLGLYNYAFIYWWELYLEDYRIVLNFCRSYLSGFHA